ncbi:bifunctional UDP-N-acetylmuramoyl-tripeptide:D-alanyl-D-alanine ligase/alanine racemase [Niabella insulamsoli]|uniref:bifunctional UDP-N-acetylmuramoyl-tripeptide:D-alanyl-D-alanine ligase/alanine racemase n=1 Tax=Niabella insulamsoli TaxID=3144874 RepID=UPI0031FCA860
MYTLKHIAALLHLSNEKLPDDVVIKTLLTDSRKLLHPASSLFFALSGPRRNGHLFIAELYKSGLRHFVVSEEIDEQLFPDAVFLKVKDVLAALQQLAAAHRSQFHIDIIGITGSNGKTTVKEWLYELLRPDENIARSPKSYNSQIGVPLSVWELEPAHSLAIFEAGISLPGEMQWLEAIIQPTIGILTNIGAAHAEGFNSDREKLQEKLSLFRRSEVLIAHVDDPLIKEAVGQLPIKTFLWGHDEACALQIVSTERQSDFTMVNFVYQNKRHSLKIPFIDQGSVENVMSCCAAALYRKMEVATLAHRVLSLQPVDMRLVFKKGINNCIVINDSYNADTDSLSIALHFLQQQARNTKKTVIISDFLQSGDAGEKLYQNILDQLQKHKISQLIGIGPQMSAFMPGLLQSGHSPVKASFYLTTSAFMEHFHSFDFKDEAILIKGARPFRFENIAALLEQKVHQTVLEINLNAIAANFKSFQQMLQPATRIMVMVKAFAYGSGGTEVASLLQYHKADYLGVAYADEGVEIRKAGVSTPIMVLNPEASAFEAITEFLLEPDLFSFEQLQAFEDHVRKAGLKDYPVHIEIETGMNRLGFDPADMELLAQKLKNNTWLRVQSVFSHLAASEDEVEDAFTLNQHQMLVKAADQLAAALDYHFLRHIANSSAIARFPALQMDMVRLGIGLYGIGSGDIAGRLQPALRLKSTIAQLKQVKKGATVSYNRRGVAQRDSLIATVRIGYADGYSRRLGNGIGYMLVKGQKAPVIGTVCMDMVMIDVTAIEDVHTGDEVVVFGDGLPLTELAKSIDTIPYEVMTGISQRVKRVYWSE